MQVPHQKDRHLPPDPAGPGGRILLPVQHGPSEQGRRLLHPAAVSEGGGGGSAACRRRGEGGPVPAAQTITVLRQEYNMPMGVQGTF